MRYIILEDEKLASNRLKELVSEVRPDYKYLLTLDSVESAVMSLPALKADLLFMDIQLADGLSFDILDQIKLETPIIFTTAYDEYAIKAFKANSIDYLLKPIDGNELLAAVEKFEKHSKSNNVEIGALMKSLKPTGKERFVVKVGEHLRTVETKNIQLIYSQDKATYLLDEVGKKHLVDYSLDKAEELIDPMQFFRISRKFLVNISYIIDMIAFTNSRLEVRVNHYDEEQIIVARERVADFKAWLDR